MSKLKSPQDKKRASLELDRRNTYGENDKASRKNIPLAKARSIRAERRAVQQTIVHVVFSEDPLAVECSAREVGLLKTRAKFIKSPDSSLQSALEGRRDHRAKRSTDA